MLGQLFTKSEIAKSWGGVAVWLVQDVLVDYIARTTSFKPADFRGRKQGEVVMLVGEMVDAGERFEVKFPQVLRGPGRPTGGAEPDFTSMLGLGHVPDVATLYPRLGANPDKTIRPTNPAKLETHRDFTWGQGSMRSSVE